MIGPTSAFGSATYSLALGASVMLLALVVMKLPGRLTMRRRPADLWRRVTRLRLALAGARRTSCSRFRRRLDLLLLHMLGDDADERHRPTRS